MSYLEMYAAIAFLVGTTMFGMIAGLYVVDAIYRRLK